MDYGKSDEDGQSLKDLLIHDILMQLPSDLFENKDNFLNFFSIETWNNLVPEDIKHHLLQYLPTFAIDDATEKDSAHWEFGWPTLTPTNLEDKTEVD